MTDTYGRTWHVIEHDDHSIAVYYTMPNLDAHFVVYDSLDAVRPRIVPARPAAPMTEPPTEPWYGVI